jgi:hypothetical protein
MYKKIKKTVVFILIMIFILSMAQISLYAADSKSSVVLDVKNNNSITMKFDLELKDFSEAFDIGLEIDTDIKDVKGNFLSKGQMDVIEKDLKESLTDEYSPMIVEEFIKLKSVKNIGTRIIFTVEFKKAEILKDAGIIVTSFDKTIKEEVFEELLEPKDYNKITNESLKKTLDKNNKESKKLKGMTALYLEDLASIVGTDTSINIYGNIKYVSSSDIKVISQNIFGKKTIKYIGTDDILIVYEKSSPLLIIIIAAVILLLLASGIILLILKGKKPDIKIVGVTGSYLGSEIPVLKDGIVLGRDPSVAQLVYSSDIAGISRKHCSVKYDKKGKNCVLVDHKSTAGTFLSDGEKLAPEKEYPLNKGDKFYLADEKNTFMIK